VRPAPVGPVQEGRNEQRDQPERTELQHALHQNGSDHGECQDRRKPTGSQDRAVRRSELSAQRLGLLRLVQPWLAEQEQDQTGAHEGRDGQEVGQPQRRHGRDRAAGQRAAHERCALHEPNTAHRPLEVAAASGLLEHRARQTRRSRLQREEPAEEAGGDHVDPDALAQTADHHAHVGGDRGEDQDAPPAPTIGEDARRPSRAGTTTAYTAAMTPTEAASKPIVVMNSFSIGTHRASPCRAAAYGGRRRGRSTLVSALVRAHLRSGRVRKDPSFPPFWSGETARGVRTHRSPLPMCCLSRPGPGRGRPVRGRP
jgi:hypothetical protein